jgi:AraC family transcriptional regulator
MSLRNTPDRIFLSPQFSIRLGDGVRLKWSYSPRADYSIVAVFPGSHGLSARGEPLPADSMAIFLSNPGTSSEVSANGARYVEITVSPSFMATAAVRARMVSGSAVVSFNRAYILSDMRFARIVNEITDELSSEEPGKEAFLTSLMEQLTINLLRRYTDVRLSNELELSRVGLIDRRVRRAVELMHGNMDRDLPLREIAAAANVSAFHFTRLFKKVIGTTPHAYLGTLRIEQAKLLLADSDLSVTEIGGRVGYPNPSHFTRAFRDATGLSPKAFRSALVTRK